MKQEIEDVLDEARGGVTDKRRLELTWELVKQLLDEAREKETTAEKKDREMLGKILYDENSKAFVITFLDQAFRSKSDGRIMRQLNFLLDQYGIPKALSFWEKAAFMFVKKVGPFWPTLFIPFVKDMVRVASEKAILPTEKEAMDKYLAKRKKEGIQINLNHLGEAILSEEEALKRIHFYLDDLKSKEIDCISVKATTLYSQIDLLAEEDTLHTLVDRLRMLYRAAMENGFKLVNLDMEEFKYLDTTVEAFLKVLEEEEFFYTTFGIALQSYIPDSFAALQRITAFAERRVRNGGAPLKIRLVKGANLAMEKVESAIKNYPQAPFLTKTETDANFFKMLEYGIEHTSAIHLGIGSHNLFDIAYIMLLREERALYKEIQFEMLEGMAPSLVRVVQGLTGNMLLYCPTASKSHFHNAIAYLMRRLDENASEQNFLHSFFDFTPDSFKLEKERFLAGLEMKDSLDSASRRGKPRVNRDPLINEPDTDWVLASPRQLLKGVYQEWSNKNAGHIPLVVGGEKVTDFPKKMFGNDPSNPDTVRYTYALATEDLAHLAVETAKRQLDRFKSSEVEHRADLLMRAAEQLKKKRFDLIGVMMADAGKTALEADTEISEAIDFCLYYRKQALEFFGYDDMAWEPRGVSIVLPPWNFPCSIPVGCIAASLVAGNPVVFKPAPQTVWVGYEVAKCFWDAGVPKEVLQFITGEDEEVGSTLVSHPDTGLICLTGSNETAKRLYELNPAVEIIAETGGKNSMIVTAMADRDLAISDIIKSAFGHSGQKCSALSLLILENEVYKDPSFFRQLHDAVKSLAVGSAFDPRSKIVPLVNEAEGKLLRGLTTLEEGEEWLIKPKQDAKNKHLWSPGVKINVRDGSFTHQTELFGPVLGVMRAKNLEQALLLANGTPYGLTAGLHSLDTNEQQQWFQRIKAGNCYINRGITGAIVERQPFGGTKESSYGRGHKAGGPNYLSQFMKGRAIDQPKDREDIPDTLKALVQALQEKLKNQEKKTFIASIESFVYHYKNRFSQKSDPQKILGEDNFLLYRPHNLMLCRMESKDNPLDLFRVIVACRLTNTPLELSLPKDLQALLPPANLLKGCTVHIEEVGGFLERFQKGSRQRLRLLRPMSEAMKRLVAKNLATVVDDPVLMNGRFELLHYLKEVALSYDYHRYGNLGMRENEERNEEV